MINMFLKLKSILQLYNMSLTTSKLNFFFEDPEFSHGTLYSPYKYNLLLKLSEIAPPGFICISKFFSNFTYIQGINSGLMFITKHDIVQVGR